MILPADSAQAGRAFAWRLSLFYGALCTIYGTQLPFLPVWLDARGFSAGEIALAGAAPMVLRILATPAIAYFADRSSDHRGVVVILSWIGLATLLAMTVSRGVGLLLLLTLVMTLATTTIMPLTETLAMTGVKRWALDYGRMRLWGSITFIVAAMIGGFFVERLGAESAIWLIVAGGALTALAAHALPAKAREGEVVRPARRITVGDAAGLMLSRRFLLFLLAAGSVQASHALFYTFGVLHWRAQGLSGTWTGALWAIAVVVEIWLFAYSARVVGRFGPLLLIVAGGMAAAARWFAMAFDPPLAALVGLQVLHALSYGAAHLGAMHYIAVEVEPERSGTAQALYASVTAGIAMGGATLLAGQLYPRFAGGAYLAMAALGAIGLVAAGLLMRGRTPASPAAA